MGKNQINVHQKTNQLRKTLFISVRLCAAAYLQFYNLRQNKTNV